MDIINEGYDLCDENWGKIREIESIGKHLNNMQRWFAADKKPDPGLLGKIDQAAASTGRLLAYLIDLQVKLLINL